MSGDNVSDIFGIGTAIQAMVKVYIETARRTGRTTHLVSGLRNDDIVIVHLDLEGKRIQQLAKAEGKEVHYKVVMPGNFQDVMLNPNRHGRVVFDHQWVEHSYLAALYDINKQIGKVQRHASGVQSKAMKERDFETQYMGKYKGDWLL